MQNRYQDRFLIDCLWITEMVVELAKLNFWVSRNRSRRLMGKMVIRAIYPRPRLIDNRKNNWKYP